MSRKTLIILTGLAIFGFYLRSYLFPANLFFGPEQGTDFKVIRDIVVSHKFTLIGPKTDIAGVFHGPIYYYLACIPFFFSQGDPYTVALFFILIQSLSVFLIFFLSYELTESKRIAYIASLLYTVSFGAISYSRWLSGQPLTIPLSALFFLFTIRFLKGEKWSLAGAAVTFGLMGQAEFMNLLLVSAIGLFLFFRYCNKIVSYPKRFLIFSFCIALIFSLGNFALFDFRHEFLISKSIMSLVSGTKGYYISLFQSLIETYDMFISASMNILGLPNTYITTIVVWCIVAILFIHKGKNQYYPLLFFWIFVPNAILIILRHRALEQLYVLLVVGIILGVSVVIDIIRQQFYPALGTLIFLLLVFLNMSLWFTSLPANYRIFFQSTQPGLRYDDQLQSVKYIYDLANGRQFYFQSYTIPYFWQDGWEYLFWYYAIKNTYVLPNEKHDELLYVIIQKDRSNPRFQQVWYEKTVSRWGLLQNSVTFGELTVEERIKEGRYEK